MVFRGTSKSSDKAAFRESFSHLHELRCIVPTSTPFITLTATATQHTKETIFDVLQMRECVEICDSPNKLNISYSVQYMDKNVELEHYLDWRIRSVQEKGINATRVITLPDY